MAGRNRRPPESQEVAEHFIQETLMPLMPIQGGLVVHPASLLSDSGAIRVF
jgi:hypothetical protein